MKTSKNLLLAILAGAALLSAASPLTAQTAEPTSAVVPRLVNYSGKATDVQGKPVSGIAGITFSIYKAQEGGAPLWMETQNVTADSKGNYTVQLGASKSDGLPLELFSSGEARWLGVRVNGGEEQPRVLLLSVPYALKAADAQTLGGLPPSAFVLAAPRAAPAASSETPGSPSATVPPPTPSNVTTTGGTANTLPLFSTSTDIENSALTQTGSFPTAKIGINTTTPSTTLDVKGSETVRGILSLHNASTATATKGGNSQPLTQIASAFNSGTGKAVNQTFRWQGGAGWKQHSQPGCIAEPAVQFRIKPTSRDRTERCQQWPHHLRPGADVPRHGHRHGRNRGHGPYRWGSKR